MDPILVVVVDDLVQLRELSDWGLDPAQVAPNLSAISANNSWLTFTNAHADVPACRPSRHAMWSGVSPCVTGLMSNKDGDDPDVPIDYVQQRLRNRGWQTHGFGKVFQLEPPNRSVDTAPPGTWDTYYGNPFADLEVGETAQSPELGNRGTFGPAGTLVDQPDHDVVTAAIPVVSALTGTQSAFVGIYKPHLPFVVPQEYFDRIDATEITPPVQKTVTGTAAEFLNKTDDMAAIIAAGKWEDLIHAYAACVNFADEQVGRILAAAPPNAHIVICSDNGYALGERGMVTKFALWDQMTGVPVWIRSPLYQGGQTHTPLMLSDLAWIIDGMSTGTAIQLDPNRVATSWFRAPSGTVGVSARDRHWHLIDYGDGTRELYADADHEECYDRIGEENIRCELLTAVQQNVGKATG